MSTESDFNKTLAPILNCLKQETAMPVLLRSRIEGIIKQILSAPHKQSLELIQPLKNLLYNELERARALEAREIASLTGKERLEAARNEVDRALGRLAARSMSTAVRAFLEDTWRHYLVLTYLEGGSDKYQAGLTFLDNLLQSMQPKISPREQAALRNSGPLLIKELEAALADGFLVNKTQLDTLVREIRTCQMTAMRGQDPAAADSTRTAPRRIAPLERNFEPKVEKSPDSYEQQVRSLKVGNWLTIMRPAGEAMHCRIAWIGSLLPRYLVVNCYGLKVADYTGDELATALRSGTVTLTEERQLFLDLALKAVSDMGSSD